MTKDKIITLVIAISADLIGLDKEEVELNSSFRDDLGCDSLLLAELIMVFEDKFDLLIPDPDIEELTTIQSAVDYIYSKQ